LDYDEEVVKCLFLGDSRSDLGRGKCLGVSEFRKVLHYGTRERSIFVFVWFGRIKRLDHGRLRDPRNSIYRKSGYNELPLGLYEDGANIESRRVSYLVVSPNLSSFAIPSHPPYV
jgi:hypothetical protein